jgi:hypothetical protein
MQPATLNTQVKMDAALIPKTCCTCAGSLAIRALRAPVEELNRSIHYILEVLVAIGRYDALRFVSVKPSLGALFRTYKRYGITSPTQKEVAKAYSNGEDDGHETPEIGLFAKELAIKSKQRD